MQLTRNMYNNDNKMLNSLKPAKILLEDKNSL